MNHARAAARGSLVSIDEILFCSDLTPESALAFEHVRMLARAFGASVTLYHASPGTDPAVTAPGVATARSLLEHEGSTLPVSYRVLVDSHPSPASALLERVRVEQPDLVVMATHGREGLSRILLGSVAGDLIDHAFRPILCLRQPDHGAALPYRRILVPTDMSPAARLAFPMAALFAHVFGAEVIAVHAIPSSGFAPRDPVQPSEATLWKALQPEFAGVAVRAQIHHGSAWRRIVDVARVENADLVVMSSRGHDSVGDWVVGSNTERVIHHSPCPVLAA